jgi:hypothetical protein
MPCTARTVAAFGALAFVVVLPGCDRLKMSATPTSYGDCLAKRLGAAHTTEAAAAIIGTCRSEFPPGSDIRKAQVKLSNVEVTGKAGTDQSYGMAGTFSGTLWNASTDHVVTEVRIRLSLKQLPFEGKAASASEGRSSWLYSVPVELWPQSAAPFSVNIIPVSDSEFEWGITAVYGVPVATARATRGLASP